MRYRALLVALLLAVTVAGCQSPGGSEDLSPPSVTESNGIVEGEPIRWPSPADPDGIHRQFTVGDPANASFDGSVWAYVWNDATTNQSLTVTLRYGSANETIHELDGRVPADEVVAYRFGRTGNYSLVVVTANSSREFSIPRDHFDCNDRSYAARVHENGTMEWTYITTELACQP